MPIVQNPGRHIGPGERYDAARQGFLEMKFNLAVKQEGQRTVMIPCECAPRCPRSMRQRRELHSCGWLSGPCHRVHPRAARAQGGGMTRLDEIRKRLAAATGGKWTVYERTREIEWINGEKRQFQYADIFSPNCPVAGLGDYEFPLHRPTADFIAMAPEDIALLLAVVEEARLFKEDEKGIMGPHLSRMQDALAPLLADTEGEK